MTILARSSRLLAQTLGTKITQTRSLLARGGINPPKPEPPSTPSPFVKIVEVGPRDGLQNESTFVSAEDKIEFIHKLLNAGCPSIEVASFVSPEWVPQMSDASLVLKGIRSRHTAELSVLVPNLNGFEEAMRTNVRIDGVAIFAAASEEFSKRNINCSVEQSMERFREVAVAAKERDLALRGYVSCVMGCPYQGEVDMEDVVRISERLMLIGCREISLGDTIGVGTPKQTLELIAKIKSAIGVENVAVHFHDTYGQALANIYAAISEGITIIDSSTAGLGGCPYAKGASGNVATEDVVYMLNGMGIRTGIDIDKLIDAGRFICNVLERPTGSKVAMASGNKEPQKEDTA